MPSSNTEIQVYVSPRELELLQGLRNAPISGYQPASGGNFVPVTQQPATVTRTVTQQSPSVYTPGPEYTPTHTTPYPKPEQQSKQFAIIGGAILAIGLGFGFIGMLNNAKQAGIRTGYSQGMAAAQAQVSAAKSAQAAAESQLLAEQSKVQSAIQALQGAQVAPVGVQISQPVQ